MRQRICLLRKMRLTEKRPGNVLILTAFLLVVAVLFLAFAVDVGFMMVARTEAQRCADAAALAGAWEIASTEGVKGNFKGVMDNVDTRAREYAKQNVVSWLNPSLSSNPTNDPKGDIVMGRLNNPSDWTEEMSFTDSSKFNSVQVRLRLDGDENGRSPFLFARILGVNDFSTTATATATFLDNVRGFKVKKDGPESSLLPFVVHQDAWNDLLEQLASGDLVQDEFSIDNNGNVIPGADGIPELRIYDKKLKGGGKDDGDKGGGKDDGDKGGGKDDSDDDCDDDGDDGKGGKDDSDDDCDDGKGGKDDDDGDCDDDEPDDDDCDDDDGVKGDSKGGKGGKGKCAIYPSLDPYVYAFFGKDNKKGKGGKDDEDDDCDDDDSGKGKSDKDDEDDDDDSGKDDEDDRDDDDCEDDDDEDDSDKGGKGEGDKDDDDDCDDDKGGKDDRDDDDDDDDDSDKGGKGKGDKDDEDDDDDSDKDDEDDRDDDDSDKGGKDDDDDDSKGGGKDDGDKGGGKDDKGGSGGGDTDGAGNWGTVDIGDSNNATPDLTRQILHGPSVDDLEHHGGSLMLDAETGTVSLNGDTGISAAIGKALEEILGDPRTMMLYSSVSGNGNNAQFEVTGFVGIRVMDVQLQGGDKYILIQPTMVTDPTAQLGQGAGNSRFVGHPIILVR